jgi:hypothetical protein
MESGPDLSDLRPANPDPNARVRGNHKGPAYALNVVNPEPGKHYVYVRREEGDIQRFENEGWTLSRRSASPATMGKETDPQWGRSLDGVIGRRDIVRMEIDEEGYRAYMERKNAQRAAQSAESVVAEFIAKGEPLTSHLNSNAPVYYQASQHRYDRKVEGVSVREEE